MNGFFIQQLAADPFGYFSWIIIVVFSICAHEFSHAAMALRMGDDTAASTGHLTLNPLKQMGLQSLIMLAVLGLAWGAVPVNPSRMTRLGRGWVSIAGPGINLLLCVGFALAGAIAARLLHEIEGAPSLLALAASANAVLFLLNMMPVPGLDGWGVLTALIPPLERRSLPPAFSLILFLLLVGTPLFDYLWRGGHLVAGVLFVSFARLAGMEF